MSARCPPSTRSRPNCCITASDVTVESPGGISPPGAPRTVREPLDSHGSRCSAFDIHEPPMSEEFRIGEAHARQPIPRTLRPPPQTLEFAPCPANQEDVDTTQGRMELRPVEMAVVVDPATD